MRALALAVLLSLTGCAALTAPFDRGLGAAEQASAALTVRSLSWLCERMSVRQWRETFGRDAVRAVAYDRLCAVEINRPAAGGGGG